MNRSQRVKEIFDGARRLEGKEREAYIDAACVDEPDGASMAREVRALLADLASATGFLEGATGGAAALAATLLATGPGEGVGTRIGPYKLLERIGEGGFGLVYMAEQEAPIRRRVALKVIKLGMDTRQVIARFEQERQALAMMDHPNIAKVLDAGATPTGRPYFVMELVRGEPITTFCDDRKLGVRDRLALVSQVCDAVQHAHQKGIIHRDIKPSNVLVTIADGDRPTPKVIDFGIAKATQARLTERTLFTEFRQMVGTPEYMSPEQAGMGGDGGIDIDTRSDVYSLGVLIYELLTGVTPFDPGRLRSAAFEELRRIIREVDPPRPSTRLSTMETLAEVAARRRTEPMRLRSAIRGELDWIVMRCLEKERVRRYATAADVSRDIARYLGNEALEAGPPGKIYRMRKFVRRHRRAVAGAVVLLATLVLGLIGTTSGAIWALRARERAERSEGMAVAAAEAEAEARRRADASAAESRSRAYGLALGLAAAGIEQGDLDQARGALAQAPLEHRGWEWSYLAWAADRTAGEYESAPDTLLVRSSGDGTLIFTRGASGEVRAFSAETGRLVRSFNVGPGVPWRGMKLEPNHDGSMVIVSHDDDGEARLGEGAVSLWDTVEGRRLWTERTETLCGVDISTGRWRRTAEGAVRIGLLDDGVLDRFTFSRERISWIVGPVGESGLVVYGIEGGADLWDLGESRWLARLPFSNFVIPDAASGQVVYLPWNHGEVHAFDFATGESRSLHIPAWDTQSVGAGAFGVVPSPGTIHIHAWPRRERIGTVLIPRSARSTGVSEDGRIVYVVESDGRTRAMAIASGQPFTVQARDRGGYASVPCPTGQRTVTVGWGSVCAYDAQTGEEEWSAYPSRAAQYAAAFSADGRLLAVGGVASAVTILEAANGRIVGRLAAPGREVVTSLAWSPAGDRLLAGLWSGGIVEFNASRPEEAGSMWARGHESPVVCLEFSPDGSRVLSASRKGLALKDYWVPAPGSDSSVRLWEGAEPREFVTILRAEEGVDAATFSPDGNLIAVAADSSIVVFDATSGARVEEAQTFQPTTALAYSRDGARIAAWGGEVRVFEARGLELLCTLGGVPAATAARFTPDGRLLAGSRTHPVIALETGPHGGTARREQVARARGAFDRAFQSAGFVSERAIELLRADGTLSTEAREVAIDMARARGDDPNQIHNATLLHTEGLAPGAAWGRYVEQMRIAVGVLPDDMNLRLTLGHCQFRAGAFRDAVETMGHVVAGSAATSHERLGRAWSVIAMARMELGEHQEARSAFERAAHHRKELKAQATQGLILLVGEAERRVGG